MKQNGDSVEVNISNQALKWWFILCCLHLASQITSWLKFLMISG